MQAFRSAGIASMSQARGQAATLATKRTTLPSHLQRIQQTQRLQVRYQCQCNGTTPSQPTIGCKWRPYERSLGERILIGAGLVYVGVHTIPPLLAFPLMLSMWLDSLKPTIEGWKDSANQDSSNADSTAAAEE